MFYHWNFGDQRLERLYFTLQYFIIGLSLKSNTFIIEKNFLANVANFVHLQSDQSYFWCGERRKTAVNVILHFCWTKFAKVILLSLRNAAMQPNAKIQLNSKSSLHIHVHCMYTTVSYWAIRLDQGPYINRVPGLVRHSWIN